MTDDDSGDIKDHPVVSRVGAAPRSLVRTWGAYEGVVGLVVHHGVTPQHSG